MNWAKKMEWKKKSLRTRGKKGKKLETLLNANGKIKWLPIAEYTEQDFDGDTIGEKIYYTPHRIVAWNDTLAGYASAFMNESKIVTIILYNGTLLDLEPGWNLISLPEFNRTPICKLYYNPLKDAMIVFNATILPIITITGSITMFQSHLIWMIWKI